ncbi:MAG: NifU family protein [Hydrogenibacillus schlegelii]|nr:NifU family protein [Hydrogenibacillus schlegelii]
MPHVQQESVQEEDFERLALRVDEAVAALKNLPEDARTKAMELKKAIERFHAFALRRLVRRLRGHEAGKALLYEAIEDPAIYALFLMHGIIKPDLATRVAVVLEEVRPYLRSHGGDVELVKVEGEIAYVRLHGACSGCSLSALTLKNAVEEAIRARVPEIAQVRMAKEDVGSGYLPLNGIDERPDLAASGWIEGPDVDALEEGKPTAVSRGDTSILLVRLEGKVMAYRNECPHMGMPLETGLVDGGVITCSWHGFRFDLSSGECLTAPHVQLEPFPVRVEGRRVWIRVG